ncbi:MAG: hypothetical protein J5661_03580 [Bacteroidaceae bacterium]|nr:hypothetical protein [Bacteroidaceae bacterium]
MKKTSMMLLLLAMGLMNIKAQQDVTKYYLVNYGFDEGFNYKAGQTTAVAQEILEIDGWTQGFTHDYTIAGIYEFGFRGTFNGARVPTQGYDGEAGGGLALSTGWGMEFAYSQEVTLPAGTYTINVPTYNGCDKTASSSLLAWKPSSGATVKSTLSSYKANAWTLDKISFRLTKTTKGQICIGMKAAENGSANSAKLVIDYVQIIGQDMAVDKGTLEADLTTANKLYGDGTGNDAEALKAAIETAQETMNDEAAQVMEVLEAQYVLEQAINQYRQKNASADNPLDRTEYIRNASFEMNNFTGWTSASFSLQNNTSFARKKGSYYIEKWVNQGTKVGNASVRQTLKNLPNGKYRLTVAAQNLNQQSTSSRCKGAYIFAGDQQKPVYTPSDYSVDFTSISGEVEIGFVAENATGNWLACDNFRLYLIGYVDQQAMIDELARLIVNAEELTGGLMSAEANEALAAALETARSMSIESSESDIRTATMTLTSAIWKAQQSRERCDLLQSETATAQALLSKHMGKAAEEALQSAIGQANAINSTTKEAVINSTITALEKATEDAQASIAIYLALEKEIAAANKIYNETLNGAEDLMAEITKAQEIYDTCQATDVEVEAETASLSRAQLAFNLANATPGSGAAPQVKSTNHYVPTGATQALMRATFSGSNILERGICWSTEHDPTVLDSRTTSYYSVSGQIYHLTGLDPATVYYLRPYVMNRTYQVAYGDEVKIVTHPKGNCSWSWDNGAPTAEANERCSNAIKETIDYFNEWTGIRGFTLSGHYGSGTPTADCSYGGYMRIGPNAAYQAIGTVIHETGHGVGVGTHWRWYSCSDTRENTTYGKWLGREANQMLQFLENKEGNSNCYMLGDGVHGWGHEATYDWFVNGADKDMHLPIQYIGGCCLLYALFIDGLCPTSSYQNGLAGYTYNFDSNTKYYLMPKSEECGLGDALLCQRSSSIVAWQPMILSGEEIGDEAAWYIDYLPSQGYYTFRNAATGKYLTHSTSSQNVSLKTVPNGRNVVATEYFQLMPDRTDVTLGTGSETIKTHGYWFTWSSNGNKAMHAVASSASDGGLVNQATFDYSDKATAQQWIIFSEEELKAYQARVTAIGQIRMTDDEQSDSLDPEAVYSIDGKRLSRPQKGFNIIRHKNGKVSKNLVP